MDDPKTHLAADADSVLEDVRRLRRLEVQRQAEPVGSPRHAELAKEIAATSRRMMADAIDQERTGHEVGVIGLTIEEIAATEGRGRPSRS